MARHVLGMQHEACMRLRALTLGLELLGLLGHQHTHAAQLLKVGDATSRAIIDGCPELPAHQPQQGKKRL